MDDLIEKVQSYIERNELLPTPRLVVGCSGGADSMALLFVLCKIVAQKYPKTELLAAHVHHGIRKEADQDEKLVHDFCLQHNVAFQSKHISVPEMAQSEKMSLESAGRKARYDFFSSLCGEDGCVAVAHHMEDQAESVAMHIFRGCGMEGLLGMRPRNGRIIRPFLCLHKEEILAFCETNDIPYVQDQTNKDESYDRNYWRQVLFPSIRKGTDRDPIQALNQLSERISEENQYLDAQAGEILERIVSETGQVTVDDLKRVPRPLLYRVLRQLALRTFGDVVDLTSVHWVNIQTFAVADEQEGYLCLPGRRMVLREHGVFYFATEEVTFQHEGFGMMETCGFLVPEETCAYSVQLSTIPMGETVNFSQSFPQIRLRSIEKDGHLVYNNSTWFFPHSCLDGAVLRTRREGDRFKRAGSSCGKELRRYMSELHIPARFRDRVLLVAKGSDVLWIPGFAHAIGFTDETSRCKCEISPEETWCELSLQADPPVVEEGTT